MGLPLGSGSDQSISQLRSVFGNLEAWGIHLLFLNLRHILVDMPKRSSKRPRDVNQLAHFIGDRLTSQAPQEEVAPDGKNPAAVALGRLGGLKGGVARAEKLSAKKRSAIASKAAQARWNKRSEE